MADTTRTGTREEEPVLPPTPSTGASSLFIDPTESCIVLELRPSSNREEAPVLLERSFHVRNSRMPKNSVFGKHVCSEPRTLNPDHDEQHPSQLDPTLARHRGRARGRCGLGARTFLAVGTLGDAAAGGLRRRVRHHDLPPRGPPGELAGQGLSGGHSVVVDRDCPDHDRPMHALPRADRAALHGRPGRRFPEHEHRRSLRGVRTDRLGETRQGGRLRGTQPREPRQNPLDRARRRPVAPDRRRLQAPHLLHHRREVWPNGEPRRTDRGDPQARAHRRDHPTRRGGPHGVGRSTRNRSGGHPAAHRRHQHRRPETRRRRRRCPTSRGPAVRRGAR